MAPDPTAPDEAVASKLVQFVIHILTDERGVRAEDAICALATIVAERCIDAAGDYPLRTHELTPGGRVFSDRANQLIAGDVASDELDQFPASSILGILRDRLAGKRYDRAHFPSIGGVFRAYAAGVGKAEDWGKVPLTVPEEHQPSVLPLRIGYETRAAVDKLMAPLGGDTARALATATLALAKLLEMVREAIDPQVALTLALETVNGMAKTAPMTDAAMQAATKR
jgi:hypothetical protein